LENAGKPLKKTGEGPGGKTSEKERVTDLKGEGRED